MDFNSSSGQKQRTFIEHSDLELISCLLEPEEYRSGRTLNFNIIVHKEHTGFSKHLYQVIYTPNITSQP